MINFKDIQSAYIELYKQLRRYLWGMDTVETIADLEVSANTTFPDLDQIRKHLSDLKIKISDVIKKDEDLKSAMDDFEELLSSSNTVYAKLNQVNEVISDESN